MRKHWWIKMVAAMVFGFIPAAVEAVVVDLVPVGNAGNAGELSGAGAGGYGPDAIVGGVPYAYQIGKFEVTAGQYTDFLNAVAKTDTFGVYHTRMADEYGCGIQRSGAVGAYAYTVSSDWANRPVNWVSWGDAARFVNWLHNGQPVGNQGPLTTEDGSYYLNGAITDAALTAVTRKTAATWVIPTEDEWYKAAYHKNDGATGNYWDYPTRTNSTPNNGNPAGDTGNTANFDDNQTSSWPADLTVGPPYYTTPVGFFPLSAGPYGTFDQGGNVGEWNETAFFGVSRGVRGGNWTAYVGAMFAPHRNYDYPTDPNGFSYGFRVALVPEPSSLALLVGGALLLLTSPRRKC
jgi:formylglycine-generating enzyme